MENFESLSIDCLECKKEIMANKEKYASLFSEGRESLEELLLTCYNNDIMSQACCSGHLVDGDSFFESYLYLKLKNSDLDIITAIIQAYRKTSLKNICDLEEDVWIRSKSKDNYGFCIRCDFDDADVVYLKLIDIINNTDRTIKSKGSIEYQILRLLRNELIKFRKRKIPKYGRGKLEASGVIIAQNRGNDIYPEAGKYLDICRTTPIFPDDFSSRDNPTNIEELIKYIHDNDVVDYTNLISRYRYEDNCQLNELKKILIKKQ